MSRHLVPVRIVVLVLMLPLLACGGGDVAAPGEEEGVVREEGVGKEFLVDSGYVGKVVDTRPIFRKGYRASEATVAFPDHGAFDATLAVDDRTNLAILSIDRDSLSADEKEAFGAGVAASVVVRDASGVTLATYEDDAMVLDDSNSPLSIPTDLPWVPRPLILREGMPHLIQAEEDGGFLTSRFSDVYGDSAYVPEVPRQHFHFSPVPGEAERYHIRHFGYSEGTYWNLAPPSADGDEGRYVYLAGDAVTQPADGPAEFVIEQDEDGWARIRHVGTGYYLAAPFPLQDEFDYLWFRPHETRRFRIISDDIEWAITDRGASFNQPIMPPARLDFGVEETLRNCSGATLQVTVGKADSRTTVTEASTTESLQLFASTTIGATLTLGYQVSAKVGVDVQGVGEAGTEVQYSAELALSGEYTTSETTTSSQSFTASEESTTEVSRERTLTVPPYTAVEVYDAVKTIRDVRVPFTQEIRVTATTRGDATPLTGPEIVSQMLFNFAGGLITDVGSDYVDITVRGQSTIDQLMKATTDVNDLPDACN